MNQKALFLVSMIVFLLAFPLALLGLLVASGDVQLVFKKELAGKIRVANQQKIQEEVNKRDQYIKESSLAFLANAEEAKRLEELKEKLVKEQKRLEALKAELKIEQNKLDERREEFVKNLQEGSEVDKKRIKKLAKMYEAMDAEEAARLMETLEDSLCIRIFNNMSEVRQKAEILAVMDGVKASRLSIQMGVELKDKKK